MYSWLAWNTPGWPQASDIPPSSSGVLLLEVCSTAASFGVTDCSPPAGSEVVPVCFFCLIDEAT